MESFLIGRKAESETMKELLSTKEAEMLAVIGRRRVGKTFLVRTIYKDHICFELTGIQNATLREQLKNFSFQLSEIMPRRKRVEEPASWTDAFMMLRQALGNTHPKRKRVIFFDELPWLASRKSGFLQALGHFWNTWASRQKIIVVICGSAASWMTDKVIYNKGGLHNRITKLINLAPFTLSETKTYLKKRKVNLDNYQIAQLYMAIGGIPHYLKEVKPGLSAAQNIDSICFSKNGLLRDEFQKLYPALFEKSENHVKIIRALASKWKGMTRNEIVSLTRLSDGGGITRILSELSVSGFISFYLPFGKKKKDTLYRLTDEYSLFYLRFIEKQVKPGTNIWLKLHQTPAWKSWSGFAFESLCLKHAVNIKHALGISGVYSEESSYTYKGSKNKEGLQIDLIIDRRDAAINLCEIKFHSSPYTLDKATARKLQNKIALFKEHTKTTKSLFMTFISSFGIKKNSYSTGIIDNNITIDALFTEPE